MCKMFEKEEAFVGGQLCTCANCQYKMAYHDYNWGSIWSDAWGYDGNEVLYQNQGHFPKDFPLIG